MADKNSETRLVYASGEGRICPECGKAASSCACRKSKRPPKGDGIVRIRRETKGRGGKAVTVITGLPLEEEALKSLAGALKRRCGVGGTVKEWTIEMQGDQVELLMAELRQRGYNVKRAGG